ncbi:MAG: hypothetical protein ABIE81_04170 [Candidatus Omnitrophota bacterium]
MNYNGGGEKWFITEQVEEEKNPAQIFEHLKILKLDSGAILF